MANAHHKPCYLLETPKAPSASKATILGDEGMIMGNNLLLFPVSKNPEMDNQQATQLELGWLAGIIDGEGYIGIQRYTTRGQYTSYTAQIQINNTDEEIILRSQKTFIKLGVNPYIRIDGYKLRNKSTHKNVWTLTINKLSKNVKVLVQITPYLTGTKKKRAELVLEFCKSRLSDYVRGSRRRRPLNEREKEIFDLCKAMQKRGASETIRKAQLEQSTLWKDQINRKSDRFVYGDCEDRVRPYVKA